MAARSAARGPLMGWQRRPTVVLFVYIVDGIKKL